MTPLYDDIRAAVERLDLDTGTATEFYARVARTVCTVVADALLTAARECDAKATSENHPALYATLAGGLLAAADRIRAGEMP